MYGNSNQHWKKTINTTNVEVVIDDPSQIQDTYITNRQIFQDIVVFDKTVNDFVYQPTSNSIGNAVSGANGSDESDTNTILYMLGGSGDFGAGGGDEVGEGGAIGGGGLGQIRRGATGGTVDIPTRDPSCLQFAEEFNKYLKLFKEFKDDELGWNPLGLYNPAGGGALRYWYNDELDENHVMYQFIACIIKNITGKPIQGTAREYIRRHYSQEGQPTKELVSRDLFPLFFPDVLPILPTQLPSGSPVSVQRWLEWHPTLLEDFDSRAKEILKKIRKIQEPGGIDSYPAPCRDLAKRFFDQLAKDILRIHRAVDKLLKLKKQFEILKASPCWEQLNMDQQFNKRNIGRFDSLEKFFEWLGPYVEKEWDGIPFNTPDVDLEPYKSMLNDAQSSILNDIYFGNSPLSERVEIASIEYEKWLNEPEESRSIFPPIKTLFRTFDEKQGSPIMVDQDVYAAWLHYAIYFNLTNEGQRALIRNTVNDYHDALINITSFWAQPEDFNFTA